MTANIMHIKFKLGKKRMKANYIIMTALLTSVTAMSAVDKAWPKRIRGFNVGGPRADLATEKVFKNMKKWHVNAIRLNFKQDTKKDIAANKKSKLVAVPEYMKPYQVNLTRLKKVLALCKKYDIYMILCASGIVGRDHKNVAQEGVDRDANSAIFEKNLVNFWKYIVTKYKDNPMIIGYDLLNEPHTKDEMKNWQSRTLPKLVKTIRAIDPKTTLVVEPGPWGLPSGFSDFKPINDQNTVYSFHFYAPHNYTHQGVGKQKREGSGIYPGKLKMFNSSAEIMWNRETLRQNMQAATDFAKKHKVRMFVGEFSVIRWARGGGAKWLEDSISLFEENGFDWTYHSYTSWNGWNPTFTADAKSSNEPDGGADTDRLKVLKKYWKLNTQDK
jgi:endoglucanase